MQGIHQRQLEKQGKSYQFGSYKYSAQDLYDRGILLSIDQYSPKQFNTISLTVSCDEIGVFEVGANVLGINVAKVELTLENLLESQAVSHFLFFFRFLLTNLFPLNRLGNKLS